MAPPDQQRVRVADKLNSEHKFVVSSTLEKAEWNNSTVIKGNVVEEIRKLKLDELYASDALLLGRVTYQEFVEAWPSITDEEGFADRMNSLPKYVVSTTLNEPDLKWNNSRLIKGDIAGEISKLKQQAGQDILISGGAGLVHSLMQWDLIDEYRLLVYPVVLGKGKHLFTDGSNSTLKLVETKMLGSDVVLLTYQPVKAQE